MSYVLWGDFADSLSVCVLIKDNHSDYVIDHLLLIHVDHNVIIHINPICNVLCISLHSVMSPQPSLA